MTLRTMPDRPRIVVFSEGRRQAAALAAPLRRAGCRVLVSDLTAVRFDTTAPRGILIPGLAGALPDAVLVRSISVGSFEAVTRRLGLLHALRRLGVTVWNSAKAIERCVDKSMTSFLLDRAGLPTPATFAVEGRKLAHALAARECLQAPLVLKPLFGAQGRGIRLIRTPDDLPGEDETGGVYYLQRWLDRSGRPFLDYRVFVCAGRAVAMMARRGDHWITNIHQGARPEVVAPSLTGPLEDLAVAAVRAVDADFAGVDIAETKAGDLVVIEVNSMPAWSGLQSVTPVRIGDEIAAALLLRLQDELSDRHVHDHAGT